MTERAGKIDSPAPTNLTTQYGLVVTPIVSYSNSDGFYYAADCRRALDGAIRHYLACDLRHKDGVIGVQKALAVKEVL